LGGASSDAAAALIAANEGWGLGWPDARLAEIAAELGSDVPFFLGHSSAVCRGRGELIEPVRVPRMHLVVVRPPVGLSTPQVYQRCLPGNPPQTVGPLLALLAGGNAAAGAGRLANRLQQPASSLTPWIARLENEFDGQGLLGHQMSGSGSSWFGICRSSRHARRVASRLRARSIGFVAGATSGFVAGTKSAAIA
jgi:4-diphosphocytidyl-2-C-methyl-D-erythritol kinase